MTAALLLFNAALHALFVTVLLRADFRRRENLMLALVVLLEAGRDVLVSVLLLRGFAVTDPLPVRVGLIGRILIVCPVLEFVYAFPSGRRPPPWLRWGGVVASGVATLCAVSPAAWSDHWLARAAFFLPFFLATSAAAYPNLARGDAFEGARPVLLALLFRFAVAMITWVFVHPLLPRFALAAFTLDVLLSVTVELVIVPAILKYRSFRVQGLLAEALLYGALSLSCLSLVVLGAEFVARNVSDAVVRSLGFAVLVLAPLGLRALFGRHAPWLESVLLHRLDKRRRLFRDVRERTLQASSGAMDVPSACQLTIEAIALLSGGQVTLWWTEAAEVGGFRAELLGCVLPPGLADHLQRSLSANIGRRSAQDAALVEALASLGADALVSVRAQGRVLCALAIEGGVVDQDLLDTATVLADSLGSKLVHRAMYESASELQSQLDATRRMSTLGSIMAAVAHDIRTPLTSVKMNLEMMRPSPALDADARECLEMALHELRRMNDYVSGMLDYVKPVRLRAVEIEPIDLIEEAARTMQPLLDSRKLALRQACAGLPAGVQVRVDAARMKQVLVNLLENAAEASKPGETIELVVDAPDAEHVAIRVRDRGHGISPATKERIFEPFFTTRSEGTGLGLAIVQKLVSAHDGEVRVESAPGAGCTFTLLLPAWRAASSPAHGVFPSTSSA